QRDHEKLVADVVEMRGMIEEAKGGEGHWNIKIAAGGLVDIEFIAQYLQLLHAHRRPGILATETERVLLAAREIGLLPAREADVLLPALNLYQALTQVLRLCVSGPFKPAEAPGRVLALLAGAAEMPGLPRLDAHLRETQAAVREAFERLIGPVLQSD